MTAAERVLQSLDDSVNVRKTKVQQAGLVVLKSPDIPSMLVETAYISNPGEESKLKSIAHQARVAEAIFRGIRSLLRNESARRARASRRCAARSWPAWSSRRPPRPDADLRTELRPRRSRATPAGYTAPLPIRPISATRAAPCRFAFFPASSSTRSPRAR